MSAGRYLDEVYFIRNDTRKIIESEWLKNNELYTYKIRFLYHALFSIRSLVMLDFQVVKTSRMNETSCIINFLLNVNRHFFLCTRCLLTFFILHNFLLTFFFTICPILRTFFSIYIKFTCVLKVDVHIIYWRFYKYTIFNVVFFLCTRYVLIFLKMLTMFKDV